MRRLALLSALLAVAACDARTDVLDVDVNGLSHDPAALVGSWDLVSRTTSGYLSPPATRPAGGEAYTFAADGTAVVERDGQPAETTTWEVARTSTLSVGGRSEFFGVDGDRLYFDSRPMDGELLEFVRR